MTVKEIITKYLNANGYDGLYSDDGECACEIDDLFPCGDASMEYCEAGYKTPCDCEERHDYHISPKKR